MYIPGCENLGMTQQRADGSGCAHGLAARAEARMRAPHLVFVDETWATTNQRVFLPGGGIDASPQS